MDLGIFGGSPPGTPCATPGASPGLDLSATVGAWGCHWLFFLERAAKNHSPKKTRRDVGLLTWQ